MTDDPLDGESCRGARQSKLCLRECKKKRWLNTLSRRICASIVIKIRKRNVKRLPF